MFVSILTNEGGGVDKVPVITIQLQTPSTAQDDGSVHHPPHHVIRAAVQGCQLSVRAGEHQGCYGVGVAVEQTVWQAADGSISAKLFALKVRAAFE